MIVERSGTTGDQPASPWNYNIDIVFGNNVWLRGLGMDAELSGEFSLRSKEDDILVFGPVGVDRGFYTFYNKQFRLNRGTILFEGETPPNPNVDITGEYKTHDVTINIAITGKSDKMNIQLTSIPALEQEDIVSYLVFGKPAALLTGRQRGTLEQEKNKFTQTEAATMALSVIGSNLMKAIGRNLDIDVINVRGGASDFTLEVGKYISDNIFLYYTHQAGEVADKKIVVEYEVSKKFTIQAERSEIGRESVNLLYILRW